MPIMRLKLWIDSDFIQFVPIDERIILLDLLPAGLLVVEVALMVLWELVIGAEHFAASAPERGGYTELFGAHGTPGGRRSTESLAF